jgi:hypothetical protein
MLSEPFTIPVDGASVADRVEFDENLSIGPFRWDQDLTTVISGTIDVLGIALGFPATRNLDDVPRDSLAEGEIPDAVQRERGS